MEIVNGVLCVSYAWVSRGTYATSGEPMCAWCGMYRKDMADPEAHLATHEDDKPTE